MKLFIREYGSGDPMIIIHGMLGMSDNWITIANQFADKYKVFLPDMRNHGLSPHEDLHTFDSMAEDINQFLDDRKIDDAIFVGHSMGGKVVLNFSDKYPEKVNKAVIVDISPRNYGLNHFEHKDLVDHAELLDYMSTLNLSAFKSRQEINSIIRQKYNKEFIVQLLQKNITKEANNIFRWKPNVKILRKSLSELSREIKINDSVCDIKSLFIFGSNSPYFTQDDYQYISQRFIDSEIKIIKGAGHAIHVEKKDDLIKEIKQFILRN